MRYVRSVCILTKKTYGVYLSYYIHTNVRPLSTFLTAALSGSNTITICFGWGAVNLISDVLRTFSELDNSALSL